jgi:GDP-L-fucose synthase
MTPKEHKVFTTSRAQLDLTNRDLVEEYFLFNKIDSVICAAAKVGGILANSENQFGFLLENLKIQNAIIEASIKAEIRNFIFLGSSCAYPKFATQPIKEDSLLTGSLEETNEGYGIAKIAGIKLCEAISSQWGLNYFSLMPSNLYGPGDNFDLADSHVPAALLRRFHEAKLNGAQEVSVWGTGAPKREFMHVDDLASACWWFLGKNVGGQLFNIGLCSDISIKDFASLVAEIDGYRGVINFDVSKPDGAPQKLLDVGRAKSYGWDSKISLKQGLHETYEWFQDAYQMQKVRGQ